MAAPGKVSLLCVLLAAGALAASATAGQPGGEHARRPPPSAAAPLRVGSASWQELTPAQRSALAPLEHDWPTMDSDGKAKWLKIAARFPRMSPDERQRIQARMSEWARMSPKERGEARLRYQELRQMSPAERQALWERYQALPPDQRRQLAAHAQPASAAARRAPARTGSAGQKSNIVSAAPPGEVKAVAPTVVQAKPGATTHLVSQLPAPPAHQQPGLPKVAATPGFVDRSTLLPKRGAQAAGTRVPLPPASAPSRR